MLPHCLPDVFSFQLANRERPGDLRRPQNALGEEDSPEAGQVRKHPALMTAALAPPGRLTKTYRSAMQLLPNASLQSLSPHPVTPSTLSLSTPLLSLQPILCPIAPRGPTILVSHSPAQNPPMILHWPRPRSQLLSLEPLPSRSGSQPHLQPCLIFLLACWTPAPCSPEPCPIFPFLGLCPGCS